MFIPEEEQVNEINTATKDNIVELSVNFIEKIFNNIKSYITMIMNFFKK